MNGLKNGMIVFMKDGRFPGKKFLDIEVTNTFPLISITKQTILINSLQEEEIIQGYDHIAIPGDLRLHISSPKDHIFFNVNPVWDFIERSKSLTEPLHYFTIFGLPSKFSREVIDPGKTKSWHQATIISPFKDKEFNESTRLFIDFFIHSFIHSQ